MSNTSSILAKLLESFLKALAKALGVKQRKRTWNQHVVPHDEGWAVKREGNKTYSSVHKKQTTAINKAKVMAKRHNADVIIHGRDGAIRERLSY